MSCAARPLSTRLQLALALSDLCGSITLARASRLVDRLARQDVRGALAPHRLTERRLGDAANKLVLDAQRSEQTGQLRPYADAELRLLLRETRSLHEQVVAGQEVFSQIESDDGQICSMLVAALTMRRNKRAMLIYHAQRIEMLKRLFWRAGGQVGAVLAPDRDERRNMSPSEVDFVRDYARLNADYRAWIMDQGPVDTAGSLEAHPPKELYVQVRVLRDVGDVVTDSGTVSFQKDTLALVRRPDVERLILNGFLEEV